MSQLSKQLSKHKPGRIWRHEDKSEVSLGVLGGQSGVQPRIAGPICCIRQGSFLLPVSADRTPGLSHQANALRLTAAHSKTTNRTSSHPCLCCQKLCSSHTALRALWDAGIHFGSMNPPAPGHAPGMAASPPRLISSTPCHLIAQGVGCLRSYHQLLALAAANGTPHPHQHQWQRHHNPSGSCEAVTQTESKT